ncbi:hypothetical protein PIB30_066714 [Stylosanthes scabra]|uniref:Uncharacterized protein n=1 Tax=Stylosanthes scabra TaxID=79078 RepID=A0ABU6XKS4_9FABA|nr:hypothetical protein [Stylosanthes scabra]
MQETSQPEDPSHPGVGWSPRRKSVVDPTHDQRDATAKVNGAALCHFGQRSVVVLVYEQVPPDQHHQVTLGILPQCIRVCILRDVLHPLSEPDHLEGEVLLPCLGILLGSGTEQLLNPHPSRVLIMSLKVPHGPTNRIIVGARGEHGSRVPDYPSRPNPNQLYWFSTRWVIGPSPSPDAAADSVTPSEASHHLLPLTHARLASPQPQPQQRTHLSLVVACPLLKLAVAPPVKLVVARSPPARVEVDLFSASHSPFRRRVCLFSQPMSRRRLPLSPAPPSLSSMLVHGLK